MTTLKTRRHRTTTVKRGFSAPIRTTYSAAPPSVPNAFTVADLGSGAQITSITARGFQTRFEEAPLWRLYLWDGAQDPYYPNSTILPNTLGAAVVVADANGFVATWTHVVYGTVVVTGAFASGKMAMTADVTLGAVPASLYSSWAFDLGCDVAPWEVAKKDLLAVMRPVVNGTLLRDATTVLAADAVMTHGEQLLPDNGRVPHGTLADPGLFGSMQMVHVYQLPETTSERARYGLTIRTNDDGGRYKEFVVNGTGTATSVRVRMWNANNLAVGANFSSDYEVILEPVAGGWHEAAQQFREHDVAEALPSVARGKIVDDVTDVVSAFMKDAPFILWIQPQDTDASWAKATREVQRFVARFGLIPVVYLYGWHANLIGDNQPSWSPVKARADTFLTAMQALGVKVVLYTLQHGWGVASPYITTPGTPPTNYNAANGVPGTQVAVNPSGVPYAVDLEGGSGPPASTHAFANLGRAGARAHVLATWPLVLNGGARWVHGFYMDSFGNAGSQDYASDLATGDKGVGARYSNDGKRTLVSAERSACRALRPDFALSTEFFLDTMPAFDMVNTPSHTYSPPDAYLPVVQAAFSEYVLLHGFDCYGTIPASTAAVGLLRDFRWVYSKHFHDGKILMLLVNADPSYLDHVGDPGDTDYGFWQTHIEPLTDYIEAMVASLDGPQNVRRFFRGRRLAPLPGSYDRYVEVEGATSEPIASPIAVHFTNADIKSSIWYCEDDETVGILLTNDADEAATFEIVVASEHYPQLGGPRTIYINGVEETTVFGSFRLTAPIPALGVVVVEISP